MRRARQQEEEEREKMNKRDKRSDEGVETHAGRATGDCTSTLTFIMPTAKQTLAPCGLNWPCSCRDTT